MRDRKHIVFLGKRKVGKSSLVNALIGRQLYAVGSKAGASTDPMKKAMELPPFGPILLIDTSGIDYIDELDEKKINKTAKAISSADFAVVVLDAKVRLSPGEAKLFYYLKKIGTPFIIVINKIEDGVNSDLLEEIKLFGVKHFEVSCKEKVGIDTLRIKMARMLPEEEPRGILADIINPADVVIFVEPNEMNIPGKRLIFPQVQAIREALDEESIMIIVKERELASAIGKLRHLPDLVITDSRELAGVDSIVPKNIGLTTFPVLMARHSGDLPLFVSYLYKINSLKNNDNILITEGCIHHREEEVKGYGNISEWLQDFTGKRFNFSFRKGEDFPEDLSGFKMIIHCGGCVINRHCMQMRIKEAKMVDLPILNYGVLVSFLQGMLNRVLEPFPEIHKIPEIKSASSFLIYKPVGSGA